MEKYRIEGMSCGGCSTAVENAVRGAVDSATVEVDLDAKALIVTGQHDASAVKQAVEEAGFEFHPWTE